jgi:hypothetical protein
MNHGERKTLPANTRFAKTAYSSTQGQTAKSAV